MTKKKIISNIITIFFILVSVVYIIYAVVMWISSKSPNDFSELPTSGTWKCEEQNFKIVINFNNTNENSDINKLEAIIYLDNKSFNLKTYEYSGHGTIFAPTKPSHILGFRCDEEECKTDFSTSKYKIADNEFCLLDIVTNKYNNLPFIKDGMDLHFIKS